MGGSSTPENVCLHASPACHSRTLILLYLDSSEREACRQVWESSWSACWVESKSVNDLYYCVHEDIHNDCTAL